MTYVRRVTPGRPLVASRPPLPSVCRERCEVCPGAVVNGLDYAGVEVLLDLLAGEQLSSECACWVEWVAALQRSEVHPESAVTAQWSTIRRARDATPPTLRALMWDAAMNAWTLGDAAGGLRAARGFAELESQASDEGVDASVGGCGPAVGGSVRGRRGGRSHPPEATCDGGGFDRRPAGGAVDRLLSIVFVDDLVLDPSPEAVNRLLVCMERSSPESPTYACLLGIEAWRARARTDLGQAELLLARGRPLAAATGAAVMRPGWRRSPSDRGHPRSPTSWAGRSARPASTRCARATAGA